MKEQGILGLYNCIQGICRGHIGLYRGYGGDVGVCRVHRVIYVIYMDIQGSWFSTILWKAESLGLRVL